MVLELERQGIGMPREGEKDELGVMCCKYSGRSRAQLRPESTAIFLTIL